MNSRNARAVVLAVVAVVGLATASRAETRSNAQAAPLPDAEIQRLVRHKMDENGFRGVQVAVMHQGVTLNGEVPSAWARQKAVEVARKTDDVRRVVDGLTIVRAESDVTLARHVARQIRHFVFYTIFDNVDVAVQNGVVTLTGEVTMPYHATDIASLVAHVKGVQQVRNQIATLPVSSYDDQIRHQIASRIYGDPDLWNYSLNPEPPIHIVVDNGRVTLTGAVDSRLDKTQVGMIANSTFGVFSVKNDLKVAA